ncbi:hypothetical protein HYW99_00940 [Candidatus Woesearchaeota archaeon]|nr:hypothetical protein [Candidatus Woesearchaeota archaeon]
MDVTQTYVKEIEILREIKEAEKKAEEILEMAKSEKEAIIREAVRNSSKLLAIKEEEIRKSQEKKLIEFRDKARLLKEEKLAEGRLIAKQIKAKSEKNIAKSVEFVMKKFEEMV